MSILLPSELSSLGEIIPKVSGEFLLVAIEGNLRLEWTGLRSRPLFLKASFGFMSANYYSNSS